MLQNHFFGDGGGLTAFHCAPRAIAIASGLYQKGGQIGVEVATSVPSLPFGRTDRVFRYSFWARMYNVAIVKR
jgi:hypothetical protein